MEPFGKEEILETIKRYPKQKSGGSDGLHSLVLSELVKSDPFLESVTSLFNLFLKLGTTPKAWNHPTLHLLLKDPSEPYATQTRPIALTQTLRRNFESLLLQHWQRAAEKPPSHASSPPPWTCLNYGQFGFRPHRSTTHAALTTHNMSASRKSHYHTAFLDLKAAFNTVPHSRLLSHLHAVGCPKHSLQLLESLMCRDLTSEIVVNGAGLGPDKIIHRTRGLFQGSLFSPFLFNLYINPLLDTVNGTAPSPSPALIAFCDDLAVKAESIAKTQDVLDTCYNWASENGMSFGIGKCGTFSTAELKLGHETLPLTREYKYLGFKHHKHGIDFVSSSKARIKQAQNTLVATKLLDGGCLPPWIKLLVYKTFIRPVAEYGLALAALIEGGVAAALTQLHNEALHWIVPGPLLTIKTKASLTGMGVSQDRSNELKGSLVQHMAKMQGDNPCQLRLWAYGAGPWPASSLLPRTIKHAPYASYLAKNVRLPVEEKLSWKAFARKTALEALNSNRLCAYIMDRCRNPGSRTDRSLLLRDASLCQKALTWRLNRMIGARCPVCGELFNRRHVMECELVEVPKAYLEKNALKYQQDMSYLMHALKGASSVYTWLDFALNERDYSFFVDLFDALRVRISWSN